MHAIFYLENAGGTPMAFKKIAISKPEDVVKAVDRAAAHQRTTRSPYIADGLRRVARARSDAEITRRINAGDVWGELPPPRGSASAGRSLPSTPMTSSRPPPEIRSRSSPCQRLT
jgi:hypothetical protein